MCDKDNIIERMHREKALSPPTKASVQSKLPLKDLVKHID